MRLLNAFMEAVCILGAMLVVIGVLFMVLVALRNLLPEKSKDFAYWMWLVLITLGLMSLGLYLNPLLQ